MNITFEGVKGVGTVELDLQADQQVYTLIGVNGVGKTKTLEALFQWFLFNNLEFSNKATVNSIQWAFSEVQSAGQCLQIKSSPLSIAQVSQQARQNKTGIPDKHQLPVVFLASQSRGFIQHSNNQKQKLGTLEERRIKYFLQLINGMNNHFNALNMSTGIEEWFVTLAQSANPYQKQEDNREVEIKTVMQLLHQIDSRIDPNSMQIIGNEKVSLKIEGQERELSHLSTGFASILKIIQAIVSGYGYFTNETRLQQVKGIVLIDEIESHLHLSWQAKIIPLLKQLFPNTTFYITTHSSVVLSQLKDGEAYRLSRDTDGVVRTIPIPSPNKTSLIDVLKEAFDIDLNQLKLENTSPADQQKAKHQLLDLIQQPKVAS